MAAPLLHPQPQPCLLDQINLAKVIAIAAIVLVHGFRGCFGWQGVHMLEVLSGFVLSYSCLRRATTPDWGRWLYSRARRLLPCYWLIVGCGALLLRLLAEPSSATLADLLLLRNFFTTR